jgi:hypothetical protein
MATMRTVTDATKRTGVMLLLAASFLVLLASPASAHGTTQVPATDYAVEVDGITPRPPTGVQARAVDGGSLLQLRNPSGSTVTIHGYDGEPYLRVGDDGVFRNARSPATFWNERADTDTPPPAGYDSSAPPRWERISGGRTVRWHDHRAHFMGAAPDGGEQVVLRFDVPLSVEGRTGELAIVGDVRYLPPPSPWAYLGVAAVIAIALIVAGRTRFWVATLTGGVVVLVAAAAIAVVGEWNANTLSFVERIGEHVYVFAGLLLGIAAIAGLITRRAHAYDATPIALLAGVALLLASGVSGIPLLAHSVLPTELPETLERALVTVTIGTGLATVVVSAMHLRRPPDARGVAAGEPGTARDSDQDSSTGIAILRSMYAEK